MRKDIYFVALGVVFIGTLATGCLGRKVNTQNANVQVNQNVVVNSNQVNSTINESANTNQDSESEEYNAFIYQVVGNFENGVSPIAVKVGQSSDGTGVESLNVTAVDWDISKNLTNFYGDPVFSRLSNGNWALTAWTGPDDTRGSGYLLYHESTCPVVDDSAVVAIAPSSASGCSPAKSLTSGKTSQIFEATGGNYVFHMVGGEIFLAHLSDETQATSDLTSICVLQNSVSTLEELDYGESTRILSKSDTGLLLSDTAMGRRSDGTWVLFVKGIDQNQKCTPGTTCELCARSIYRTTSTDLLHWTELEKVVEQASVPEASVQDGIVWLYWQDFSDVCVDDNQMLGSIAPISAAYEVAGTFELSESTRITFPDEEFQTNTKLHYATNANPVALPDVAARRAFEACFE